MVAARDQRHRGELPVYQQHRLWLVARQLDRAIEQRFVVHHLAATRTSVCTHHQPGQGIFHPRGQRTRSKAAKHHRMDRANTDAGQHGEGRLGDHGHVNQHQVALAHPQFAHHCSHALYLGMQLDEGIAALQPGFSGNRDQGRLMRSLQQMPIHRVMAQVGGTADKPLGKGRLAVVAYHLRR